MKYSDIGIEDVKNINNVPDVMIKLIREITELKNRYYIYEINAEKDDDTENFYIDFKIVDLIIEYHYNKNNNKWNIIIIDNKENTNDYLKCYEEFIDVITVIQKSLIDYRKYLKKQYEEKVEIYSNILYGNDKRC